MSKQIEYNPEDARGKDFKVIVKEPWYTNLGCERKISTIPISDISDYSIFIKKNLSDAKGFSIKTKSSKWYKAKEILSSPSGSVIYFDEQIGKVFKKGCIYPVVIMLPRVLTFKLIERITKDLFKKNHKSNWL